MFNKSISPMESITNVFQYIKYPRSERAFFFLSRFIKSAWFKVQNRRNDRGRCETILYLIRAPALTLGKLSWPPRWTSTMWTYEVEAVPVTASGLAYTPLSFLLSCLGLPFSRHRSLSRGHFTILLPATWSRSLNHVGPVG